MRRATVRVRDQMTRSYPMKRTMRKIEAVGFAVRVTGDHAVLPVRRQIHAQDPMGMAQFSMQVP